MKQENPVTTDVVVAKIKEVQGLLAKLREQACAEDGAGDEFQKHQPQGSGLAKLEKEYASAADAVRAFNKAGTQEGAEGLAASAALLKISSARNRARKEAGKEIR
jgi:hypothetical protein